MSVEYLGQPLTVERIEAAYKATGLRPATGTYLGSTAGEPCACALAAVALAEGHPASNVVALVCDNAPDGFLEGWDGLERDPLPSEEDGWRLAEVARGVVWFGDA